MKRFVIAVFTALSCVLTSAQTFFPDEIWDEEVEFIDGKFEVDTITCQEIAKKKVDAEVAEYKKLLEIQKQKQKNLEFLSKQTKCPDELKDLLNEAWTKGANNTGIAISQPNSRTNGGLVALQVLKTAKNFSSSTKNLNKGKIDEIILSRINTYSRIVSDDILLLEQKIASLDTYEWQDYCPSDSRPLCPARNPLYKYRERGGVDQQVIQKLDYRLQTKGWEWANSTYTDSQSESIFEKHEAHYPIHYTGYIHKEHPDIIGIERNYGLYDKEGNLVRTISCHWGYDFEEMDAVKKEFYIRDYKANKYDIKSKSSDTQTYIKKHLGLPVNDAKDKTNQAKAKNALIGMAKSEQDKRYATSQSQYRTANANGQKAAAAFVGAWLNSIDEDGQNFIAQLEQDHEDEFALRHRTERLDNNSFRVYFMNPKTKEITHIVEINYRNKGKFDLEVGTVIVKR